ncbi:MAG: DUF2726 domain-containing protein [Reyranellaceae bacterium]
MPPEIVALIDKPYLLTAVLAVGAMMGMALEAFAVELRRRAWRKKNAGRWNNGTRRGPDVRATRETPESRRPDAVDQLRIVMGAQFSARPLLNRSEARVFKELDRIVLGCNPGWQVMAQVSLGEILLSKDAVAFSCVNSKRVDLLLVDENCHPRHAIEYQGGGHYQGTAAARDAVKKEALRRAGITYHEVVAGRTTPAELRLLVERLLARPK